MAGRASVEFFVGQSLKGKRSVEEAYVMRVLKNGFVVFVPRFTSFLIRLLLGLKCIDLDWRDWSM